MALRELDSNKHSVFLLFYHLILVVKHRKRVINRRVSARLKEMFIKIGGKYGISLVKWSGEEDHIHCLFKAKPTTALAKFINAYKSGGCSKNTNPLTQKSFKSSPLYRQISQLLRYLSIHTQVKPAEGLGYSQETFCNRDYP
jgi:REP element-mobilizing transposase RayT